MIKRQIRLVDTTLRDGEQSAGLAFSVKDKILMAGWLDEAGIDQIEAGIPALGRSEIEACSQITSNCQSALVSTWNRLNTEDIKTSFECKPDIIHISAPVSYAQLYVKLRRNKRWLVNQLIECVELARSENYQVTVGFEDASRADICFMLTLATMLSDLGVDMIRYADTVGVLHPGKIMDDVRTLISNSGIRVQIHTHNDLGMATANALAAVCAGASAVDCTVAGIGERTGNCNLKDFLLAARSQLGTHVRLSDAAQLETLFIPYFNQAKKAAVK